MRRDELNVIYEDDKMLVVEKPSGLLTMSTGKSGEVTAYSILYDYIRNAGRGRGRQERIFIVHRLDRDTSGLLVFAKDIETKKALQENWDSIILERRYIALLEGHIEDEEGWIEAWLYENPKSMKVHCYALEEGDSYDNPPRKDWQYSSSRCRKIKTGEIGGRPYTCVEFRLETGRKNQIRAHSQWIGHPVAGDRKYGAESNPLGRLALHAETLSFRHPYTEKVLTFRSPVPKSFSRLK